VNVWERVLGPVAMERWDPLWREIRDDEGESNRGSKRVIVWSRGIPLMTCYTLDILTYMAS